MSSLSRVFRIPLRHPLLIGSAFFCSIMVGLLWGANIGTLYPMLDILFRGESFSESIHRQVETAEAALAKTQEELTLAEKQGDETLASVIRSRKIAEEKSLQFAKKIEPYVTNYLPDDPFQSLAFLMLALGVAGLVRSIFLMLSEFLVARLTQWTELELRNQLFAKVLELDLNLFAKDRTSGLINRFTHMVDQVTRCVSMVFGQGIREPLKVIVCLVGAAMISWQMIFVGALIVLPGVMLIRYFTLLLRRKSKGELNGYRDLYARLYETFNGIKTVKTYTSEAIEQQRFEKVTEGLSKQRKRVSLFHSAIKPITELTVTGAVIAALLLGAHLVLNQETHLFGIPIASQPLTAPALIVFYGFIIGAAEPARKMVALVTQLSLVSVACDQIYQLMDRESAIKESETPEALSDEPSPLIFKNVHFRYLPKEPVLEEITLTVAPTETICIIGRNGCGKSTLLNLIPRFHDPDQGNIKLGKVNLRKCTLHDLRSRIGTLTQETWLFDDTIYNNILYARPDATEEEVYAASKQAHAHEFITEKLDRGYKTNVGQHGGRLSGGQRQRIALARLILRDPQIILLDEMTTHIDQESERVIYETLKDFLKNKAALIVSHHPSAMKLADRIIVMDHGKIIDSGTHDELMETSTFYQGFCLTEVQKVA